MNAGIEKIVSVMVYHCCWHLKTLITNKYAKAEPYKVKRVGGHVVKLTVKLLYAWCR